MSAFSDAFVGITTGIGTLASATVLVYRTFFASKRVARKASIETAEKLLEAMADGEITPEEIAEIQRDLREGDT